MAFEVYCRWFGKVIRCEKYKSKEDCLGCCKNKQDWLDDISEVEAESNAKLNFVMQILDGLNSKSNTIYIATTNFYDKLDFRLKRKGRFDKEIELKGYNDEGSIEKFCSKFNITSKSIFPDGIDTNEYITPVDLQDMCINYLFNEAREKLNKGE